MVKHQSPRLDATFAALADPTRRAIVARLAAGDTSVGQLARPFAMSLPAVSKHLTVLEHAGLVRRDRQGRLRRCSLVARPMRDAAEWIERYRRFWEAELDRLAQYLEDTTPTVEVTPAWPPNSSLPLPSASGAPSGPRRPASSKRGPRRRK
jgi:DNA-binding transcriptional ArsR family regulator